MTTDLWCRKRLLYQLSQYLYCPVKVLLILFVPQSNIIGCPCGYYDLIFAFRCLVREQQQFIFLINHSSDSEPFSA